MTPVAKECLLKYLRELHDFEIRMVTTAQRNLASQMDALQLAKAAVVSVRDVIKAAEEGVRKRDARAAEIATTIAEIEALPTTEEKAQRCDASTNTL